MSGPSVRPIIFSAPMVRALLNASKTQTRRLAKPGGGSRVWQKQTPSGQSMWMTDVPHAHGPASAIRMPASIGDRLWVRETFSGPHHYEWQRVSPALWLPRSPIWYWADGNPNDGDWTRLKPSIHMPRWASRLTLTVTDVRVQRLQEITAADAIAEGTPSTWGDWIGEPPDWAVQSISRHGDASGTHIWDNRPSVQNFGLLWDSIHGPGAWDTNPWVVALTFTVHQRNINQ